MKFSGVLTCAICILTSATLMAVAGKAADQQPDKGALNGQVGVTKSNGEVVPPTMATVYVFYSGGMGGRGSTQGHTEFWHGNDLDTAGGQFKERFNNLLQKNKDLNRVQKSARHNPGPRDANQIATYVLQDIDEAMARVRSWLANHPDRSWQMKTIAPNTRGFWSAEGLQPGEYDVIVRGKFPGYDADWEATVDLSPGKAISLPLTRPRFFAAADVQPK